MNQKNTAIILVSVAIILTGVVAYFTIINKKVTQPIVPAQEITRPQLLEMKFSLDVLRSWQINQVFQYPQNPNKFYYIMEDSNGQNIWVFDASKDKNYLQNKNPDILAYSELLISEKINNNNEFRGVGFDGDKFVFAETSKNNSPGPCSSPWFYDKLSYINIRGAEINRQSYAISAEKRQQLQNESEECQKN